MAHNTSVASHDTTSTNRKQSNADKSQTSEHSAIDSVADNSDAERGVVEEMRGRQRSSGRSISTSLTDTCAGVGNVAEEKADECRSKEEPRNEKA